MARFNRSRSTISKATICAICMKLNVALVLSFLQAVPSKLSHPPDGRLLFARDLNAPHR